VTQRLPGGESSAYPFGGTIRADIGGPNTSLLMLANFEGGVINDLPLNLLLAAHQLWGEVPSAAPLQES